MHKFDIALMVVYTSYMFCSAVFNQSVQIHCCLSEVNPREIGKKLYLPGQHNLRFSDTTQMEYGTYAYSHV